MSDDECDELMDLFLKDTDVFGSRPPNTIISKPGDLTRDEKLLVKDLFLEYVDMPGQDSHESFSPALYKEFFSEIFRYWVSSHRINNRPVLQDQTDEQTKIEIDASWAESKPQVAKKSPNDNTSDNSYMFRPKILRKRKICQSIYLTMEFNAKEETFAWTWEDEECEILNSARLRRSLPQGVTKNDAILMAIGNYDSFERKRITSYNLDQIINAARRRIHKWARAGSSHDDTIDEHDKLGESCILSLVLASDVYLRTARDVAEIAAGIKQRRSMVTA